MRAWLALFVFAVSFGCATSRPRPNALLVSADQVPTEELRQTLRKSAFNYFRFVNIEFSQEVCRRFEPVLPALPIVNLHGDAHIEQFAVTRQSAGLVDFDDSVSGPAVLDLVRFGVSIRLAYERRGWSGAEQALDTFIGAYRDGLANKPSLPEPAIVKRLRSKFTGSSAEFLKMVEGLMSPVEEPRRSEAQGGYQRYVDLMLRVRPDWSREYLALKRWGALRKSGIGSARSARLLVRIEGATSADDDDIVLEAKEVRDLSAVECVQTQRGDALRVVFGTLSFSRREDPFLAVIPRGPEESAADAPWWIQSWSPDYGAIEVDHTFRTTGELLEFIATVGAQMAVGHTRLLPPPYDELLRAQLGAMLTKHEGDVRKAIDSLTVMVGSAFAAFSAR